MTRNELNCILTEIRNAAGAGAQALVRADVYLANGDVIAGREIISVDRCTTIVGLRMGTAPIRYQSIESIAGIVPTPNP